MVKRLFFKQGEKIYRYTVLEYETVGDFYVFVDVIDGLTRKFHKNIFIGEEEMKGDEENA